MIEILKKFVGQSTQTKQLQPAENTSRLSTAIPANAPVETVQLSSNKSIEFKSTNDTLFDAYLNHDAAIAVLEREAGVKDKEPSAQDETYFGEKRKFYQTESGTYLSSNRVKRDGQDAILKGGVSRLVERVNPRPDIEAHGKAIIAEDPERRFFVMGGPAQGIYERIGTTEDRVQGYFDQ